MDGDSRSETPRRALIVEDNPVEARFMQQMLTRAREGGAPGVPLFESDIAGTLADGLARLAAAPFDVILLDLNLPDSRGLATFGRLSAAGHGLPVVVLTNETDEDLAMAAVRGGAQDYLDKATVTSKLLVRFLRYAMERHRLLSDVRQLASAAEARDRQSRHVIETLQSGFSRLASGDTTVRVSGNAAESREPEDLASLLESFDRTVADLEAAGELRAQFHSMAAHDMRSPLASIQLAISAYDSEAFDPAARRKLTAMIGRQIRKLVHLMDNLLDFFVLTSGGMQLTVEPVELNDLAADCARDLERLAAERAQTFAVERLEGGAVVECDRLKLVRVLDNLATNAIKYSNEGGAIRISLSSDGPECVRIEVQDHGPGLPEGEREKVFERFHRVEGGNRKIKGSGLGLAICKDYVAAHGGRIWVEGAPGAGCKFCIVLPRRAIAGTAAAKSGGA